MLTSTVLYSASCTPSSLLTPIRGASASTREPVAAPVIHSEGATRDDDDDDAFVIVQQEPVVEAVQEVAQDDEADHGAMMRKINEIKVPILAYAKHG